MNCENGLGRNDTKMINTFILWSDINALMSLYARSITPAFQTIGERALQNIIEQNAWYIVSNIIHSMVMTKMGFTAILLHCNDVTSHYDFHITLLFV